MDLMHAMRIFARVAEAESFTRAAQQLDLSVPVVTRSIASLELHLDARLFNRTTRRVVLTEAGQAYLEGCRAVLDQIEDIEANIARSSSETRGILRVVASPGFALSRLVPIFSAYRQRYPGIALQVTLMDRQVDIIDEGFDVGVVTEHMVRSETMIMRPLVTLSRIPVATPDYLSRAGLPKAPADLERLAFLAPSNDMHGAHWDFIDGEASTRVHLTPIFSANSALMLKAAVLEGMGFSILPESMIRSELQRGELVRLVSPAVVQDGDVSIYVTYPSRRFINRRVRTFIDHITTSFHSDVAP